MKTILAFAGTSSRTSINKQLVAYVGSHLAGVDFKLLDLNDFLMPMFTEDEHGKGIPQTAHDFLALIKSSDALVISLAEHNGAYATVFKNLFDWVSIIDGKLWSDKPMLLMATSPGACGGQTVLDIAKGRFPYMGGNIIETFSLPSFGENFKDGGIVDKDLKADLLSKINIFEQSI